MAIPRRDGGLSTDFGTRASSPRRGYVNDTGEHAAWRIPDKPGQQWAIAPRPPHELETKLSRSHAKKELLLRSTADRPIARRTRSRVEETTVRTLILGGDGYLGWPTALHLSDRGHEVAIGDNFVRRQYDHEMGVESLVPIEPLHTRTRAWHEHTGRSIDTFVADLTDAHATFDMIERFRPDTIIHFAEQRAAPYSMIDREHAVYTQHNNVIGNLNVLYAIKEI